MNRYFKTYLSTVTDFKQNNRKEHNFKMYLCLYTNAEIQYGGL